MIDLEQPVWMPNDSTLSSMDGIDYDMQPRPPPDQLLRPPVKPQSPFVADDHRPKEFDGKFRVVVVSTGSVASVKMPSLVASLSKDPAIQLQVVASGASLHFYDQTAIDTAVRSAWGIPEEMTGADWGVRIWTDKDEWADWAKIGDPILHIELRRWADLVIVAPCSADTLAKMAAGFCDNLALSLIRALPPSTPVMLCPAMNTFMYAHPFTSKHISALRELGYLVLGPQIGGKLACGDEGEGKMTDWRDIVIAIQDMAALFRMRREQHSAELVARRDVVLRNPSETKSQPEDPRPRVPVELPPAFSLMRPVWGEASWPNGDAHKWQAEPGLPSQRPHEPAPGPSAASISMAAVNQPAIEHWHTMTQGEYWEKRWWLGIAWGEQPPRS